MKTSVYTIIIVIIFAICCVSSAYAAFTLDPNENKCEIKKVPMSKVPDYLMPLYYDPDDTYIPEVICYNTKINNAKHIVVCKRLYDRPLWGDDPLYFFYDGTFLSSFGENIEKMCNSVPLIKKEEKLQKQPNLLLQPLRKNLLMHRPRLHSIREYMKV